MHGAHRHPQGAGVLPARRHPPVRAPPDGEELNLLVVHGPPGIGKETISAIVAARLGYPRLSMHDVAAPWAAVLGWGTPSFYAVRDQVQPIVVRAILREPLPGLVMTYIFEATVDLALIREYAAAARTVFVGLTCTLEEHARRASSDGRRARRKWIDPAVLTAMMQAGEFAFPALPGESHVVDTTGLTPEQSAERIVALV